MYHKPLSNRLVTHLESDRSNNMIRASFPSAIAYVHK